MLSLSRNSVRNEKSGECKVQLTSLVDVMTILLVFLLKSFSVEGNIITPSADLELPVSSSNSSARLMKTLKITRNDLISDNQVIASISSIRNSDSMTIKPLMDWFESHKTGNNFVYKDIMIQSDKEQSFDVIKKVMFTCSQAGIKDFTILVLHEE